MTLETYTMIERINDTWRTTLTSNAPADMIAAIRNCRYANGANHAEANLNVHCSIQASETLSERIARLNTPMFEIID